MLLLPFLLVIIIALIRVRTIRCARVWAGVLISVLMVGLADALVNIFWRDKSCGRACFNPDIGYPANMPAWTITVGVGLGVVAVLLSITIIIVSFQKNSKKQNK